MAGLVIAHRLKHGYVRPFGGVRRRRVLLKHAAHAFANGAQFSRRRAHDVARHDGGGGLAQGAGLHIMGEIAHLSVLEDKIHCHGRAAELRMGGCGGVRMRQAAKTGNFRSKLKDPLVVDVIHHVERLFRGRSHSRRIYD